MLRSVSLPVWLLVLIVGFAAVTFASHFLLPSVRWFFRRRLEKAVARLNARLDRPIELFRLAARQDMIVRLSYVISGYDPAGRDVVFVPVGLAYDRVLEDRILTEAAAAGVRKFRADLPAIAWFTARLLGRRLRGRFLGFGTAAAGFGAPLSLRAAFAEDAAVTPEALADRLMAAIIAVVPVLPVPLVAYALAVAAPVDRAGLEAAVVEAQAALVAAGAVLKLPPQGMAALIREGLEPLVRRGIVGADLVPLAGPLLEFYAAPLRQRLENRQSLP